MPLTKRQKAYREYLKSDHWKKLRNQAIARDGGKCVTCGDTTWLQVHHKIYRGFYQNSLLRDLETLCRKCHRIQHGLGPTDFQSKCREIARYFHYQKRPPKSDWLELKTLISNKDDLMDFGELMFKFIFYVVSYEREHKLQEDWWMNKDKNRFWFHRAFNVRESIWERAL